MEHFEPLSLETEVIDTAKPVIENFVTTLTFNDTTNPFIEDKNTVSNKIMPNNKLSVYLLIKFIFL